MPPTKKQKREDADVLVIVGPAKVEFPCHSFVLEYNSRFFEVGLSTRWNKKNAKGMKVVEFSKGNPLTRLEFYSVILPGSIARIKK